MDARCASHAGNAESPNDPPTLHRVPDKINAARHNPRTVMVKPTLPLPIV
jgi:hypothetical protein